MNDEQFVQSQILFHERVLADIKAGMVFWCETRECWVPMDEKREDCEAFTTLSKVLLSHAAPGGGASLIRALLEKRLPVIGNSNGTISGLMISKRKYKT